MFREGDVVVVVNQDGFKEFEGKVLECIWLHDLLFYRVSQPGDLYATVYHEKRVMRKEHWYVDYCVQLGRDQEVVGSVAPVTG